ncbi:MAG: hypothetical protein KDA36_12250, partial [Planctomycetaceae bacterium]|nr:hypothetical protein [Planctomycetaceae bacterium]
PNENSPPRLFDLKNRQTKKLDLPYARQVVWNQKGTELFYLEAEPPRIHHYSFPKFQELSVVELEGRWPTAIALNPQSSELAIAHTSGRNSCTDSRISLWKPGEKTVHSNTAGLGCWANAMFWTPDGKYLGIATQDGFDTQYDPFVGEIVYYSEQSYALTCSTSADGKTSMDSYGRTFDIGAPLPRTLESALHREPIACRIRAHDQRLMLVHSTGLSAISLCNLEDRWHWVGGFAIRHLETETADQSLIVGGNRELIGLDAAMEVTWRIYPSTEAEVVAIAAHPRQPLIALALNDQTIEFWNSQSDKPFAIASHPHRIFKIAWSRSGDKLAVVGDGTQTQVLDADGKQLAEHKLPPAAYQEIEWKPDDSGYLVGSPPMADRANQQQVWNVVLDETSTEGTPFPIGSATPPIYDSTGMLWISPNYQPGRFDPQTYEGRILSGDYSLLKQTAFPTKSKVALTSDKRVLAVATDEGV